MLFFGLHSHLPFGAVIRGRQVSFELQFKDRKTKYPEAKMERNRTDAPLHPAHACVEEEFSVAEVAPSQSGQRVGNAASR